MTGRPAETGAGEAAAGAAGGGGGERGGRRYWRAWRWNRRLSLRFGGRGRWNFVGNRCGGLVGRPRRWRCVERLGGRQGFGKRTLRCGRTFRDRLAGGLRGGLAWNDRFGVQRHPQTDTHSHDNRCQGGNRNRPQPSFVNTKPGNRRQRAGRRGRRSGMGPPRENLIDRADRNQMGMVNVSDAAGLIAIRTFRTIKTV
nr:hypothetical protein MTCCP1_00035 [uncultured bacterium]